MNQRTNEQKQGPRSKRSTVPVKDDSLSFTLAMREAVIKLLQHFQRLLSVVCSMDWQEAQSFALAVREAFVDLFQHFQRLLSLGNLSCSLRTIV